MGAPEMLLVSELIFRSAAGVVLTRSIGTRFFRITRGGGPRPAEIANHIGSLNAALTFVAALGVLLYGHHSLKDRL